MTAPAAACHVATATPDSVRVAAVAKLDAGAADVVSAEPEVIAVTVTPAVA